MNMSVKVDPAIIQRDNRTMRKDKLPLFIQFDSNGFFDQSHALVFTKGLTQSIVVALKEEQPTI